jgi:hypothetical protein
MPWGGGVTGALGREEGAGLLPPLAAERPPVAATERPELRRPALVGVLLKVLVAVVRLGGLVGRLELVDRRELALAAWEARLLGRRSTVFNAAGLSGSALACSALACSALACSALVGDGLARLVATAGSGLADSWITGAAVAKALLAAAGEAAAADTPGASKESALAELELGALELGAAADSLGPPMLLMPADSLVALPVTLEPSEGSDGASLLGGELAMARGSDAVIRKQGGRAKAASVSAVGLPAVDDAGDG